MELLTRLCARLRSPSRGALMAAADLAHREYTIGQPTRQLDAPAVADSRGGDALAVFARVK